MAPDPNGAPAPTPAPPEPVIRIVFAGPTSSECRIEAPAITPGQLYLAAFLLDALAREVRAGQAAQSALGGLVPAPAALLAALNAADPGRRA